MNISLCCLDTHSRTGIPRYSASPHLAIKIYKLGVRFYLAVYYVVNERLLLGYFYNPWTRYLISYSISLHNPILLIHRKSYWGHFKTSYALYVLADYSSHILNVNQQTIMPLFTGVRSMHMIYKWSAGCFLEWDVECFLSSRCFVKLWSARCQLLHLGTDWSHARWI